MKTIVDNLYTESNKAFEFKIDDIIQKDIKLKQ